MILLFDIGNTHTHLGLANPRRVVRQTDIPTAAWFKRDAAEPVARFLGGEMPEGVAFCSVVPRATPRVWRFVTAQWHLHPLELTATTVQGIGVDYPKPETIGPDRLANAVAARHYFGTPVVVLDFGTALTFDVVNQHGNYVGGVIAPGLSAMTEYLHEKTALLPRITMRDVDAAIGRSTEQAMLIGAVHGYRGLVREVIAELKCELKCRRLPVVATGGCAKLMAVKLTEITAVRPLLTLEGLRLVWAGQSRRLRRAEPRLVATGRKRSGLSTPGPVSAIVAAHEPDR
jgi:type III pantothenate kinase